MAEDPTQAQATAEAADRNRGESESSRMCPSWPSIIFEGDHWLHTGWVSKCVSNKLKAKA